MQQRLNYSAAFSGFRRPGPITLMLVIWLVAEILTFGFIVDKIGLTGALLLGLATSVLGFASLKRVSSDALAHLRRRMNGVTQQHVDMLDGTLTALGSILLILPGFLSDLIGMALLSPSLRNGLRSIVGASSHSAQTGRPGSRPDVIDLEAEDWRYVDESQQQKHK